MMMMTANVMMYDANDHHYYDYDSVTKKAISVLKCDDDEKDDQWLRC